MRLKCDLIFQHIGDKWVGVPVGDDAIGSDFMLQLNDEGHAIVSMMANGTERDAIVARLMDEYEAERSEIEQCVDATIEYLNGQGLII